MGAKTGKRGKDGVLSAVIDPLLLEGGRTVNELTAFLEPQFVGQFDAAKIRNNIRARIFNLRRKGFRIETTEGRRNRKIRLVAPETTSVA